MDKDLSLLPLCEFYPPPTIRDKRRQPESELPRFTAHVGMWHMNSIGFNSSTSLLSLIADIRARLLLHLRSLHTSILCPCGPCSSSSRYIAPKTNCLLACVQTAQKCLGSLRTPLLLQLATSRNAPDPPLLHPCELLTPPR
jgi:hypothetical protein